MQRISYQGFNNNCATFVTGTNARAGYPQKLDESGKTSNCKDSDAFYGICLSSRGGYSTVQLQGYVETTYSGKGITYGYQKLVSDDHGGVKLAAADADIPYVRVIKIDDYDGKVGFIL